MSTAWKTHIDVNIERYFKAYATRLKSERDRTVQICRSGLKEDRLVQTLSADSLYVEIRWTKGEWDQHSLRSSLVLRFKSIEIPSPGAQRDLRLDKWDEKVTFAAEENVMIYGYSLSIHTIEHFLFPGFTPATEPPQISSEPLRYGKHTGTFGNYIVEYTLVPFENMSAISIDVITVPLRHLMTFSTPHLIGTELVFTGSSYRVRRASPLFNTFEDELQLLADNVFAQRRHEEYERWKLNAEHFYGNSYVDYLDRRREMMICQECCREGTCIAHFAEKQRKSTSRRMNSAPPEVPAFVEEIDSWDIAEGLEKLGRESIAHLSDNDTLVEFEGSSRGLWGYGEYEWSSDEADTLPPPAPLSDYEDDGLHEIERPMSCVAIAKAQSTNEHQLRRVSSCL